MNNPFGLHSAGKFCSEEASVSESAISLTKAITISAAMASVAVLSSCGGGEDTAAPPTEINRPDASQDPRDRCGHCRCRWNALPAVWH